MSRRVRNTWTHAVMADVDPEEPRPHVVCRRCGERLVTELPMRLETYIEVIRGFEKAHDGCKEAHDA